MPHPARASHPDPPLDAPIRIQLSYYLEEEDDESRDTQLKRGEVDILALESLMLTSVRPNRQIIFMRLPNKTMHLRSHDPAELREWFGLFEALIEAARKERASGRNSDLSADNAGLVIQRGYLGKSKVLSGSEEDPRWTNFTLRYFVLCALNENKVSSRPKSFIKGRLKQRSGFGATARGTNRAGSAGRRIFQLSYFTDDTMKNKRGDLLLDTTATATFLSANPKVGRRGGASKEGEAAGGTEGEPAGGEPNADAGREGGPGPSGRREGVGPPSQDGAWRDAVLSELKFQSPVYIALHSKDWQLLLCPRNEEDAVQWRYALDGSIHHKRVQDGKKTKPTLRNVSIKK